MGVQPAQVEKPKRLTIETRPLEFFGERKWAAFVQVDGKTIYSPLGLADTEGSARAAAQAYVDELLAHFRAGGE